MLAESKRQGVDTVVATPHFYARNDSVATFLEKRARAVEQLGDGLPEGVRLRLGAEVLLQEGVSTVDLRPLCMEGTNTLLVELPFAPPSARLYEELENIALGQRLDIMLAHVDRYMLWYSQEQMESMMDLPALTVQLNAESILDWRTYYQLQRWLPSAEQLVFGSDMHHMASRSPNLKPAIQRLKWFPVGRHWMALAQETENILMMR